MYYTIRVQCTYYQITMYYTIKVQCNLLLGYNVLYYQGTVYYIIRVNCTKISGYNVLHYQGTVLHIIRVQCTWLSGYNVTILSGCNVLHFQGTMYYTIRLQCTILPGYNAQYYQGTVYYINMVQCTVLAGYNLLYYQGTMYYTIRVQCTVMQEFNLLNGFTHCTLTNGHNLIHWNNLRAGNGGRGWPQGEEKYIVVQKGGGLHGETFCPFVVFIFVSHEHWSFSLRLYSTIPTFLITMYSVSNYINTMKTTFDFNFDLYQAVKQIHRNEEVKRSCLLKNLSMNTFKIVIHKKVVNNENLNKKSSLWYW